MCPHRVLLVCSLLAVVVSAPASAAGGPDPGKRAQEAAPAKPETQLKSGMPAEEVLAIMGKPRDKNPMKAPSGKAEVWVYARTISDVATQIEVGAKQTTDTVVGGDGIARTVIIASEPILKMAHKITYEEISLLMFNDRFVQAKVLVRQRRDIE